MQKICTTQTASSLPAVEPQVGADAPVLRVPTPPPIPEFVRDDLTPEEVIQKALEQEADYQEFVLRQKRPELLRAGRGSSLPSWADSATARVLADEPAAQKRVRGYWWALEHPPGQNPPSP